MGHGACTHGRRTDAAGLGEDFGHVDVGTSHFEFGEAVFVAGVGDVFVPASVILCYVKTDCFHACSERC